MKHYLPYNKNLKLKSRDLRNHSTKGEVLLWLKLRARSMMGYQFHRQKPLLHYIVDFYCQPLKLVIEIDGGYHNLPDVHGQDERRQKELQTLDLNFLRFGEMQVQDETSVVLLEIQKYILTYEAKNPSCMQFKQRRSNPPATNPKE